MVDVDVDPSRRYLLSRLAHVVARVEAEVRARRAADPSADQPFRGLYLSGELIDALLAADDAGAPWSSEPDGTADHARLDRLRRACALSPAEVDILLLALAPDVFGRIEQFYGYLHNDVSRRRASVGLALRLTGASPGDPASRAALQPGGPLVDTGLVVVEDADRPFLSRALRVPDRVTQHLLGGDRMDPVVARLLVDVPPLAVTDPAPLARALSTDCRLVYLREARDSGTAYAFAAAVFGQLGAAALAVDLTLLATDEPIDRALARIGLEARLRGAGLVCGPVEALADRGRDAVRGLTDLDWPTVVIGQSTWDPAWASDVPAVVEVAGLTPAVRTALWRAALGDAGPDGFEPARATATFHLGPAQIARAATHATVAAGLHGRPVTHADLQAGARAQNGTGLERLSRRITPSVRWADLVLPPKVLDKLGELALRARWRERVLGDWGLRRGGSRGEGITALFAGPPGTGKTMAAEAVAGELGLDLYAIDLAMVVDKYIGETEKNLDRLFAEAERVSGVLFFDEADALFGKRSEVRDARDKYANVETAFLLQRMESYGGIAILATNLSANLDEALARRLDAVVDFPAPDEAARLTLWERSLVPGVPRGDDLDLAHCARAFELSGGHIRNVAVCAAYLAADAGEPVGMNHVIRAVEREYDKLGRLCLEAEFGPWFHLARAGA